MEVDGKSYWFLHGNEESLSRFRERGVWENEVERALDLVRRIRPGDRIAIKKCFNKTDGLPFDVGGRIVSVMRIWATGTVIVNAGDGRTVKVAWDGPIKPRDWYFFTYLKPVAKANPRQESFPRLIDFTFRGAQQDHALFLADPFWRKKYRISLDTISDASRKTG
jgi:5-methylcytosine-specific restriction protein B